MFLGDGGHLRWGSFAIGDICDGGPESLDDALLKRVVTEDVLFSVDAFKTLACHNVVTVVYRHT